MRSFMSFCYLIFCVTFSAYSNCTVAGISSKALPLVLWPSISSEESGQPPKYLISPRFDIRSRSAFFLGLLAGGPAAVW